MQEGGIVVCCQGEDDVRVARGSGGLGDVYKGDVVVLLAWVTPTSSERGPASVHVFG